MSQVKINLDVIDRIIHFPRPEIEVRYKDRWNDLEGLIVLMDEHQFSLRRWITENQVWYQPDWLTVMAGIAIRLALAHAEGYIHKDLKPSNGSFLEK